MPEYLSPRQTQILQLMVLYGTDYLMIDKILGVKPTAARKYICNGDESAAVRLGLKDLEPIFPTDTRLYGEDIPVYQEGKKRMNTTLVLMTALSRGLIDGNLEAATPIGRIGAEGMKFVNGEWKEVESIL